MKDHLIKTLSKGIRYDGRKLDEFRPLTVTYDISKSAEGSAQVQLGKTNIIVGVKMSVDKPYPDTPDRGNLMVNAELIPMASPEFEAGPPDIYSIELARVVDRGIRESKAIDTRELCITVAEKCWGVSIDIIPLNAHGNLLDAAALGALGALKKAHFPKYENGIIDYETRSTKKIPLVREPIAVTVFKIGPHLLVDPIPEEEECVDARLTITVTDDNTICALQKGGDMPLTLDEIGHMIDLALRIAPQLRSKL